MGYMTITGFRRLENFSKSQSDLNSEPKLFFSYILVAYAIPPLSEALTHLLEINTLKAVKFRYTLASENSGKLLMYHT